MVTADEVKEKLQETLQAADVVGAVVCGHRRGADAAGPGPLYEG